MLSWDEHTRVYAKEDGSCALLFFYAGSWHVASLGMPDGGGRLQSCDMTFGQVRSDAVFFPLVVVYLRVSCGLS